MKSLTLRLVLLAAAAVGFSLGSDSQAERFDNIIVAQAATGSTDPTQAVLALQNAGRALGKARAAVDAALAKVTAATARFQEAEIERRALEQRSRNTTLTSHFTPIDNDSGEPATTIADVVAASAAALEAEQLAKLDLQTAKDLLAVAEKDFDAAKRAVAQLLPEVLECDSDDPDRRLRGCTKLLKRSDLDSGSLALAYSRRSDIYLKQNKFKEAIADRAKALELEPHDELHKARLSAAHHLRGLYHSERKNQQRAIGYYTEAVQAYADNHAALEARALSFVQIGRLDEAILDLAVAHQLQPTNPAYTFELASLYRRRGSGHMLNSGFEDAVADYTEAIRLLGPNADLYVLRAEAHSENDDPQLAIEDLDRAITLDSNAVDAFFLRGQLYAAGRRSDRAVADFSKVIELDPHKAQAFLLRGLAREELGRLAVAESDYKEVLRLQPKNGTAKAGLARIKSVQALKKSLQRN